jgi:hypothetical protein
MFCLLKMIIYESRGHAIMPTSIRASGSGGTSVTSPFISSMFTGGPGPHLLIVGVANCSGDVDIN